jgi:hypothetical protein
MLEQWRKDNGLCVKCGGEFANGLAIEQTYVASKPDFIGCNQVQTVHAGGPGLLVEVSKKCKGCGASYT